MRVGAARLVGRQVQLRELEDALLGASRGEGQVLVVAGEAGLGKSRLVREFRGRVGRLGWSVLAGSCSEAELSVPYLPVVEALGNYLAGADVAEIQVRLGSLVRELAQLFPQLHPDPVRVDALNAPQAKLRLFEAVVALLRLAGEGRGLVVVVEDIHWADASTRDLLDYLSRRLRQSRALLVMTCRPDELNRRHPVTALLATWRRAAMASTVRLGPLSAVEVGALVGDVFDTDTVSGELGQLLWAKAEGNPFVVEELIAEAVQRGDIYPT